MVKTETCPQCGWNPYESETMENDDFYQVAGETYPKTRNYKRVSNYMGVFEDWTEIHKCPTCKVEFTMSNSN